MITVKYDLDPDDPAEIIEALVATFDFTLPGRGGKSLGVDLATAAAAGLADRSAQGLDPERQPWKPNERAYAKYKMDRYDVDRPGELSGQMLSLMNLLGKPIYGTDTIEMVYGLGLRPPEQGITKARNDAELRTSEMQAKDVEKADWFSTGDDGRYPARKFYQLDEEITEKLIDTAQKALDDYIEAAGY